MTGARGAGRPPLTLQFLLRLPKLLQLREVLVEDEHLGEAERGHGGRRARITLRGRAAPGDCGDHSRARQPRYCARAPPRRPAAPRPSLRRTSENRCPEHLANDLDRTKRKYNVTAASFTYVVDSTNLKVTVECDRMAFTAAPKPPETKTPNSTEAS